MPVPEFITQLRSKIGHAPLWLVGVTAVVHDADRVLLVRRSDSGEWSSVSGIVEPGEHPAVTAVREALEEACVEVVVERLSAVNVTRPVTYPNGDQSQYTNLVFRCRYLGGIAAVGDDESTEVAWFPFDALPPLSASEHARLASAMRDEPDTLLDLATEA
ncbi:NUDIX domain-containing protein [Amnibacterium flavum]|uniref:NUDIX hydrolase n=1 Tax=Amnibacterium flavum TaxID=2173173 RepID=A0A2V1HR27_9MICO|nr:NUDIX domain-containing protein [Amnibacterium flavum]PVZ94102.1 NUDIX hydrolase [Amnibacterium flavum]